MLNKTKITDTGMMPPPTQSSCYLGSGNNIIGMSKADAKECQIQNITIMTIFLSLQ